MSDISKEASVSDILAMAEAIGPISTFHDRCRIIREHLQKSRAADAQTIAELRAGIEQIRTTATIHYMGEAFNPEHMRGIANFCIGLNNGEKEPQDIVGGPAPILVQELQETIAELTKERDKAISRQLEGEAETVEYEKLFGHVPHEQLLSAMQTTIAERDALLEDKERLKTAWREAVKQLNKHGRAIPSELDLVHHLMTRGE